jgi:hypothetical protein
MAGLAVSLLAADQATDSWRVVGDPGGSEHRFEFTKVTQDIVLIR